jgi:hypothetical protein
VVAVLARDSLRTAARKVVLDARSAVVDVQIPADEPVVMQARVTTPPARITSS